MSLKLLLFALFCLGEAQTLNPPDCGYAGGKGAPWMAYLDVMFLSEVQPRHCEAVLISDQWLLTAAQCTRKDGEPVAVIVAHLGKQNISLSVEFGQQSQFVDVVVHPKYPNNSEDQWSFFPDFDVALLKLRSRVAFTPICLPDDICQRASAISSYDAFCDVLSLDGWEFRSNFLERKNVSLLSAAECDAALVEYDIESRVPLDKMCTEYTAGGQCYQNNVGGPMLCRRGQTSYAVGLLSGMLDDVCPDTGKPLIYTRICPALPWIRSVLDGSYSATNTFQLKAKSAQSKLSLPPVSYDTAHMPSVLSMFNKLLNPTNKCLIPFVENTRIFLDEEDARPGDIVEIDTVITALCSNDLGISVTESICVADGIWFPEIKVCQRFQLPKTNQLLQSTTTTARITTTISKKPATAAKKINNAFFTTSTRRPTSPRKFFTSTAKKTMQEFTIDLGAAAASGNTEEVRYLLEQGADVNSRQFDGRSVCGWDRMTNATALILAAACNQTLEVFQVLLTYGANVHLEGNDGNTALIVAASWGRTDIIKLLLSYGANINTKNKIGKTALMKACSQGNLEAVMLLVDRGADMELTDGDNWTALSTAAYYGHSVIVRQLLELGADPSKCTFVLCAL